jgi:hypothetical protein
VKQQMITTKGTKYTKGDRSPEKRRPRITRIFANADSRFSPSLIRADSRPFAGTFVIGKAPSQSTFRAFVPFRVFWIFRGFSPLAA